MNWSIILGIISIVSFIIPVTIIIAYRFYNHRSLAALMVYYIMEALYYMMFEHLLPVTTNFQAGFGILDNYLDAPLMMTSLLFFCPNKQKQRKVYILTALFISYELIITFIYGFKPVSVTYILGPGLGIILIYSCFLFARQVKFTIVHGKNTGRTLMLASILFVYACYSFIYILYYVQKTNFVRDTYIIYFISSIVSSSLMCVGLIMAKKRLKELDDLRITRKELKLFFNT